MNDNEDLTWLYRGTWQAGYYWSEEASILKRAADKIRAACVDVRRRWEEKIEQSEPCPQVVTLERKGTDLELYPVYMLLAGYALENAFKGIIVCGTWLYNTKCIRVNNFKDLRVPKKDSIACMPINNHGLSNLLQVKAMTLSFDPEEKKVMAELDDCVWWGGRYPVPKEYKIGKSFFTPPMVPSGEPFSIIDRIYGKAMTELARLIELQRPLLGEVETPPPRC
jgi:hypothetical protein